MALIEASGWKAFPSRLADQPIFYPVTNQAYAAQIARDWNVKASGAGFVTQFEGRDGEVHAPSGCKWMCRPARSKAMDGDALLFE